MANRKIMITGGGTGGHLFPALAIGEEINSRDPDAEIHYVGSAFGLEAKVFRSRLLGILFYQFVASIEGLVFKEFVVIPFFL